MFGTAPNGLQENNQRITILKPLQRKTYQLSEIMIYEDKDVIVCHKPAGLPVQTKNLTAKDLESLLKNHLSKTSVAVPPYLAAINRLDQPVEGLILFAKNAKAANGLTKQLCEGKIKKEYLAITSSIPSISSQTLTDYLQKDGKSNLSCIVSSSVKGAKKAVLDYEIITENAKHALLKVCLKTGRHHQIRVQLSHMGTPLLGDLKYGGAPSSQLCLCSSHLSFFHPVTATTMDFRVQPKNPEFVSYYAFLSE